MERGGLSTRHSLKMRVTLWNGDRQWDSVGESRICFQGGLKHLPRARKNCGLKTKRIDKTGQVLRLTLMKEVIQDFREKKKNLQKSYFNLGIHINFLLYDLAYFYTGEEGHNLFVFRASKRP